MSDSPPLARRLGFGILVLYGVGDILGAGIYALVGNVKGAAAILSGATVAFYAFIGFEDTLNVAEEAREPRRTLPIGIVAAMLTATALYIAVAITAVSVVPWRELARQPLFSSRPGPGQTGASASACLCVRSPFQPSSNSV